MAILKIHNKARGITYVYESESYWDKELKKPRAKRKLIGKIDPVTGEVVPCGKRGPNKKKTEKNQEGANYQELQKMQQKYQKSQEELTRTKLELSETKKQLSDVNRQNQKMAATIRKMRDLVAEN